MSNDKPFQPEFGPNGAVLNAPTMTPEMRQEIQSSQTFPGMLKSLGGWRAIGVCILFIAIGLIAAGVLREKLLGSSWYAFMIAGMGGGLATLFVTERLKRTWAERSRVWRLMLRTAADLLRVVALILLCVDPALWRTALVLSLVAGVFDVADRAISHLKLRRLES